MQLLCSTEHEKDHGGERSCAGVAEIVLSVSEKNGVGTHTLGCFQKTMERSRPASDVGLVLTSYCNPVQFYQQVYFRCHGK